MPALFDAIHARFMRAVDDARDALTLPADESRRATQRATDTLKDALSQFQLMQGHLTEGERQAILQVADELQHALALLQNRAPRALP
jgi:hypothetical protein